MSYEAKYLKYKNKYLELKIKLGITQKGGGKQKLETSTETTLPSLSSDNNNFPQLGGARVRKSRSKKSSSRSSKSSRSSRSRVSKRNALDNSDLEEEDEDIMDKMEDEDDFSSSSDLDW
jgi:hypothetical protein